MLIIWIEEGIGLCLMAGIVALLWLFWPDLLRERARWRLRRTWRQRIDR